MRFPKFRLLLVCGLVPTVASLAFSFGNLEKCSYSTTHRIETVAPDTLESELLDALAPSDISKAVACIAIPGWD